MLTRASGYYIYREWPVIGNYTANPIKNMLLDVAVLLNFVPEPAIFSVKIGISAKNNAG